MDDRVAYFGFGSLVNKVTLRTSFLDIIPARLKGWRRHWEPRDNFAGTDVPFLSIHQSDISTIEGMVVIDRLENLPSVDEREAGYDRVLLLPDQLELLGDFDLPEQTYVYVARKAETVPTQGALLQSYLDAVMQGFRNEFGEDGLKRFMETTDGFNREIIADRNEPFYPRSVMLNDEEMLLFDRLLKNAGVLYT